MLCGMAYYHKEHQDWVSCMECTEEALTLLPEARKKTPFRDAEVRLLILLADVAEGQGDMARALEIDQKALAAYNEIPNRIFMFEFVDALRREALKKLRAGKPEEAIRHLSPVPRRYLELLEYSGINMSQLFVLKPVMAAMKVLAAAMLKRGGLTTRCWQTWRRPRPFWRRTGKEP